MDLAIIFKEMLEDMMEWYIDELVVSSIQRMDSLKHLRQHQLKMEPLKCTVEVKSHKFLGLIVRHMGIEQTHKDKGYRIAPISSENLGTQRAIRSLAYICRFISNLMDDINLSPD